MTQQPQMQDSPVSFTTLVGVDEQHVEELRLVWPTWKKYKPQILAHPLLLVCDADLSPQEWSQKLDFLDHPHVRCLPWQMTGVNQREKMLTGITLAAARHIHTPWFLKLDTDVVATQAADWIQSEWFAPDEHGILPAFITSSWGYTKPADAIQILDGWAQTVPELARYENLSLIPKPGRNKVCHSRITSWCYFGNTLWTRKVLRYCGDRLPVASHDTFLWYCAERMQAFYRKTRMSKHGWKHLGQQHPVAAADSDKNSCEDAGKQTGQKEDVCVIVTCHNYGRFLQECLESILSQTHRPAEILVILDACTDDSGAVVGQYRGKGVRAVEIESRDVYLARRAGLKRTASPFVMFVDADDVLPETYVADLLVGMDNPEIGIVTGRAVKFGLASGTWDPKPDQTDFEQHNGATASSLVRRCALDEAQCFEDWNQVGTLNQDWATWREIVRAGYRVAKVNTEYKRRIHETNATIHVHRPDLVRVISDRPKVLYVGPCLGAGGVECHLLMLLSGQRRVEWHAALVQERGRADDVAVKSVLDHMPVFGGLVESDIVNSRLIIREDTDVATLHRLEAEADVIYAWGATQRILTQTTLPIVYAVHCSANAGVSSTAAVAPLAKAIISSGEYATSMVPPEHRDKVVIIPNGVNLRRLVPTRDRAEMLREWGVLPGHHAIGFVGRWSPEKNPLALAEAIHSLGSKFHAVYCGPQQGGIGRAVPKAARERAERLCNGRITWTYTKEVGNVYAALSALVLPSMNEVCSLTAIESMASGCPLVATPAGHLPELEKRVPGIVEFIPFAPTGDQLAHSIHQVLTPEGQRKVQKAQNHVLENFTARRMVDAWEDVLIKAARR